MRASCVAAAWMAAWALAGPAVAVTIQFDYSRDANGFFTSQERRDALEFVASRLESRLADDLLPIVAKAGNTWSAVLFDPATGLSANVDNLDVPENTLVVFAGGRELGGSTLGRGGPGGYSASGSQAWLDLVARRGESAAAGASPTDFGPWGGAVSFDTSTTWHFGTTTAGLTAGQYDFVSVAMHELGHLLGVGTADSWDTFRSGSSFTGVAASEAYDLGGAVPLNPNLDHLANGTQDNGRETAMDPSINTGVRKGFTELDYALLDDLGWDLVFSPAVGDLNGDFVVDNEDISAFVLGLIDVNAFQAAYPGVDPTFVGDLNGDLALDNEDINPFVVLLLGGAAAVPEPTSATLAAVGMLGVVAASALRGGRGPRTG